MLRGEVAVVGRLPTKAHIVEDVACDLGFLQIAARVFPPERLERDVVKRIGRKQSVQALRSDE